MKNDICIAKINHLKVMNGLPMPIKALFWRGIRFSSVKIYLAFTDLSCRGKRLLDDRWNGRSVMQLYIWTRTLYSAVSKILSIWLINDLNYSILPLKKTCILHFQFNQNISIYMIRQKDKKDTVACVLKIEKSYKTSGVLSPPLTPPQDLVWLNFLDIFQLHVIHVIY